MEKSKNKTFDFIDSQINPEHEYDLDCPQRLTRKKGDHHFVKEYCRSLCVNKNCKTRIKLKIYGKSIVGK
jgi:hypothetical protein